MASTTKSTKSTKAAEVEEAVEAELSLKQLVNQAIDEVTEQLGLESKDRYKAARAIMFTAVANAVNDGSIDDLVAQTVEEAGDLPAGFGLERSVAAEKPAPAKKAASTKATKEAPAAAAKRPARRSRPTR
jgi:hypothetical protein